MLKTFTGVCPVQNKEYSIQIDYIDTSDLESTSYAKGLASCDYNKFGDKCNASKCPIINSAPDII